MNRSTLIQRICDERVKIERTLKKITERLEKIKTAPIEYKEEIEMAIAKNLVDCYRETENIFKEIAMDIDLRLPDGSRWQKELLTQMTELQAERQPVISQETFEALEELLEFRHVFRNIYEDELIYERAERHAKQVNPLFDRFSKELDVFIAWLKRLELHE